MRVATVQNRSQSDDSTMVGGASLNSPQEFEFLINVIVNKSDKQFVLSSNKLAFLSLPPHQIKSCFFLFAYNIFSSPCIFF